jgi:hypothetical protein
MNYEKIYNQIIERAKNRVLDSYTEKHHIIPKCMNGTDDTNNIVELTAREHFICHRLLHRMYPKNNKLGWAFIMMCNVSNNLQCRYIPSSRAFEEARLLVIQYNKEMGAKKRGKRYPKISEAKLGYKFSDESKARMSESNKNMSNEKRANIVNAVRKAKKGSFWVTDGTNNILVRCGHDIPFGYVRGRKLIYTLEQRTAQSNKMKGRFVGANNPSAKRVGQYTYDGILINKFNTLKEAEISTGIRICKIRNICNGKQYHSTYIFKFL